MQVIEYLKNNPEAAKASYEQAQRIIQVLAVPSWRHTSLCPSPLILGMQGCCTDVCCLQNPGMAQQMVSLQQSAAQATPEQREKLAALKTDPELKLIFDDIEANGPSKHHSTFSVLSLFWTGQCSLT